MKYNAFISYSHAADDQLAPSLQAALHKLARPWNRMRALRVFRDKTSLAASPELWPSIVDALSTMAIGDRMIKVLSWYDNEWGYACRTADLCAFLAKRGL